MYIFDVETTTSNKGNPFDLTNKCILLGIKKYKENKHHLINGDVFNKRLNATFQGTPEDKNLLIGFNIKFDLHWARRLGYDISNVKVWDCQIAQFLLRHQDTSYLSLNDCLLEAGIPFKLDVVKKYWDQGIDTDQIPEEDLKDYLKGDLDKTEELFKWQLPRIREAGLLPLMELQCQDLLVLEEIEWNGIKYNSEESIKHAECYQKRSNEIIACVYDYLGYSNFNIGSNDHLSAILYGGILKEERRIPKGVYKTGAKIGQQRFSIERNEYVLPRRFIPLKNTEVKKGGYYKVDFDTLNFIKPIDKKDKFLIDNILELNKISKLISTYLIGWPDFITRYNWEKDTIHGNLNQCVAITGRLSSTQPNMQNADPITKTFMYPRNGVKINIDVKGLEVLCAAFLSRDRTLIKELEDNVDIHEENRKAFNLPERVIAKKLKFRIIYGGTEYGFVKDNDFKNVSTSLEYWEKVISKYYAKYSGIYKWHKSLVAQAMNGGIISPFKRKYVYDCSGERINEPPIKNYIVQGFGADLVSLIRVIFYSRIKYISDKILLVNTVHDSIEIDTSVGYERIVKNAMEETLEELPKEIKRRFNVDFDLDLKVEIETL